MKVYLLQECDDFDDGAEYRILEVFLKEEKAISRKHTLEVLEEQRRVKLKDEAYPYKIWYDIEEWEVIE